MPSPVCSAFKPIARSPRLLRLAALAAFFLASPARGQVVLTHTEDAAPIPQGVLRFRLATGWTRFDERFISGGTRRLDDEISTNALGTQQFPLLAPIEAGLQTLSNSPASRLSLGVLDARTNVRTVTTPIALEYGVTRQLSIGVLIPVVQTRRAVHITVNADSLNNGNATYLPGRIRSSAAQANAVVYAAYSSAADSLFTLLSRCPTNPAAAGCAAVNANTPDVAQARQQALAFASAVRNALGTDSSSALIAPRTGKPLALAIDAQRIAINARLAKYLGSSAGAPSQVFTSDVPFSYVDLQGRGTTTGLFQDTRVGLDSVQTTNRLVLPGITIGAQYLLFDRFQRDTTAPRGVQMRLGIGGAVRFESVNADSAARIGSISPSNGSGFQLRSAMDVASGNFIGTLTARFDKYFARPVVTSISGDPDAFFPYPAYAPVMKTEGNTFGVDVTPRYLLGKWLTLDGHYGLERTAPATYTGLPDLASLSTSAPPPAFTPGTAARTAHRFGYGVRYSTFDSYFRGVTRTPIEVSFTHLETVAGDPGVAKIQRDQIQVRMFFRLFSQGR